MVDLSNSGGRAPRLPESERIFSGESITMGNSMRMLTPENLAAGLDHFDIGFQGVVRTWDAMLRRDDTLSFVVPQLEHSIAAKPWGVFKKDGADPIEAARHAAALEYFYDHVTASNAIDGNVRGGRQMLLRQMGSAAAMRYAVHHFIWQPQAGHMIEVEGAAPVPALTAEMEFVPLWYFENTTGVLRFLPNGAGHEVAGRSLDWNGEWMVTTGAGMMFAACICYVFKRLTFQDWTIFNERYAQPKVMGQTNAQKGSSPGQAMAEIIANFNGDQGIVLYEVQQTDKPPISLLGPEGLSSVDIFERFLDRQDRKMTVMFRGSDLRNMSREKDTTGVSAQTEETEALEIAHCANIADSCHTYIDRQVIRYSFGEGVAPLAYFGLPEMEIDDAKALRENAGFLADRGVAVDLNAVAARLGVTLTTLRAAALQPTGRAPATAANSTANIAQLDRLQQLVEEALRQPQNRAQR